MITPETRSDFDATKKAEYYDEEGFELADRDNVDQLKKPKRLNELTPAWSNNTSTNES